MHWPREKSLVLLVSEFPLNRLVVYHIFLALFLYINPGNGIFGTLTLVLLIPFFLIIPGILIARVIRFQPNLSDFLLVSVALSLLYIMVLGAVTDRLLINVGFTQPLSKWNIFGVYSVLNIILYYVNPDGEWGYDVQEVVQFDQKDGKILALLVLTLIISLIGSYLNRVYHENIVVLFTIIFIALFPILIYTGYVDKRLYQIIIYVLSLSLLYTRILYKPFIHGDAVWEYYFADFTIETLHWTSLTGSKVGSLLHINIFYPVFAIVTGSDLTMVLQYISPLLFAIVPVLVYKISTTIINDRGAFFAAFLLTSNWVYHIKLTNVYRQQFAMLFLAMFVYVLVNPNRLDTDLNMNIGNYLGILFGFGIIVSHYGVSFIFLIIIGATAVTIFIFDSIQDDTSIETSLLSILPLLLILTFTWYVFVGSLLRLPTLLILDAIRDVLMFSVSTEGSGARYLAAQSWSISYTLLKAMNVMVVSIVGLGFFIRSALKLYMRDYDHAVYYILSGYSGILLASVVLFPSANPMDLARVYPLTLIWLAPFGVWGFRSAVGGGVSIVSRVRVHSAFQYGRVFIPIFLAFFLLINSGWVMTFTGEHQYNDALSTSRIGNTDLNQEADYFYTTYTQKDISGARWLASYRDTQTNVYGTHSSRLLQAYGEIPRFPGYPPGEEGQGINKVFNPTTKETIRAGPSGYYYLREFHTEEKVFVRQVGVANWVFSDATPMMNDLNNESKVFTNGGSQVYKRE